MHALPLYCVLLTTADCQELAGLPPPAVAFRYAHAASAFVAHLEARRQWGGDLADRLVPVLEDARARALATWWELAQMATCRAYGLAERLDGARRARGLHDWRAHGLPPFLPGRWLPTAP